MMNEQAVKGTSFPKLRAILGTDEFGVFLPLVGIMVVTTLIRPDFLSVGNFSAMFTQLTFIALTALGASFPLMVGQVDISTGRVAGLAGIIMSALVVDGGMNQWVAILIGIAACLVVGLINGILVVYFDIPDFVATMGTLYMVGGARYLFIKGYQFSLTTQEGFTLVAVFDKRYLGMPIYFWLMILIFAFVFVVIKKTLWGRRLLAVGDNREVAALAGINTNKVRIEAYIISSFLSAIAGILLTLDIGLGLPETGDGWEFRAIAGCVVGGVSLAGGKGSPLGVLIGVSLVFVAENAIIFLGCPATMKVAVQGLLMAGAVLFDLYRQKRKIPA
ncbi:MAG: ABC transporter permease [Lachnospiraceae bacterium]|nr:ABC transporter permease [Lachnospiraceae bacterium]